MDRINVDELIESYTLYGPGVLDLVFRRDLSDDVGELVSESIADPASYEKAKERAAILSKNVDEMFKGHVNGAISRDELKSEIEKASSAQMEALRLAHEIDKRNLRRMHWTMRQSYNHLADGHISELNRLHRINDSLDFGIVWTKER